ncbi:TRZ/ATZ family hydrolase [Marinobacteraceae bacterium S3BR75-40.1]
MTDAQAPQSVDLEVAARWVVPVVPQGQVLDHHSVIVHQGKILDVCPSDQVGGRYTPGERRDLGHHVLIPGLINMHGHAAMTLFRGLADDLPLMTWLNDHIWPAEGRFVNADFVADGSLLAIAEMLRGGTTCFSDMYFFPEETARVAQEHRIRAQVCFPVLDFPTNWGSGPEEYLRKGLELADRYRNSDFIQVGFGPHAPYTVSDGPLKQVATLAAQTDAIVQIHLHETAHEVTEAIQNTGLRPTQRLAELGLLTPGTQCVHMTQVDDQDLKVLSETGAHVVHCPESNLKLASGFCPVSRLMDAGVNVTLGTDGAASNNDLDLLGEMRTAALLAKAVSGDAASVGAHQALAMATIQGARAMGREADLGSLEAGKCADMVAIDLSEAWTQPVYDPVSHLVYSSVSRQVSDSWIDGEAHVRDGELLRIDLHGLRERIEGWARKIAASD